MRFHHKRSTFPGRNGVLPETLTRLFPFFCRCLDFIDGISRLFLPSFFLVFTEFYHFRRFQSMNRPTVPEIGKPVSFFFRFGLLFNDEKKKERGTISFI